MKRLLDLFNDSSRKIWILNSRYCQNQEMAKDGALVVYTNKYVENATPFSLEAIRNIGTYKYDTFLQSYQNERFEILGKDSPDLSRIKSIWHFYYDVKKNDIILFVTGNTILGYYVVTGDIIKVKDEGKEIYHGWESESIRFERPLSIDKKFNSPYFKMIGEFRDMVVDALKQNIKIFPIDTNYIGHFVIPDGVTEIPENAFKGCSKLTGVSIPDSVTSIGNRSFYGCEALTNITIPNSVTHIGISAFENCKNLSNIVLSNSITTIEEFTFCNCHSLKTIVIPKSINHIENGPFMCCANLESITVDKGNPFYTSIDGVLYNKTKTRIEACPNGKKGTFIIPESVSSIGPCAFCDCSEIENIEIPNSITSIGNYAFGNCSKLTNIDIPNSVNEIGEYSFFDCKQLVSVHCRIEKINEIRIYEKVFEGCNLSECTLYVPAGAEKSYKKHPIFCQFKEVHSEKEVVSAEEEKDFKYKDLKDKYDILDKKRSNETHYVIREGVTKIEEFAFENCKKIIDIDIPKSVREIDITAFSGCIGLANINVDERNIFFLHEDGVLYNKTKTEIIFVSRSIKGNFRIPDLVSKIGDFAFENCINLNAIEIPNSLTEIGRHAFERCSSLTYINIPKSVTKIGSWSFKECISLSDIEIPNSVSKIGFSAFEGCISLTKITLSNSISFIGGLAFYGCASLKKIEIPNSVKKIFKSAFENCSKLQNIDIPDSVISIGNDVFKDCTSLTRITIPNSVTSIGNEVFKCCLSLTKIDIPNSVTSIGKNAFESCKKLSNIEIPNSVTVIDEFAFVNCRSLWTIVIPESVKKIGNGSFIYCSNLDNIYVDKNNPNYTSINGVLYNKSKTIIKAFPNGRKGDFVIPKSVTSIGAGAFFGCSRITSIEIPESITEIRKLAFYGCSNLNSIHCRIEKINEIKIDENIFDQCNLSECILYVPDGTVEDYKQHFIFSNCKDKIAEKKTKHEELKDTILDKSKSSKTHYVIREGIKEIEASAFKNCDEVVTIDIPDSVISIGEYTFEGCENLKSVNIPNSVTSIGNGAFSRCSSLTNIVIPNSISIIGDNTFECSGLKSIEIPDSVTYIGDNAFWGSDLVSIEIPNSVTRIGMQAFGACTSLRQIDIPYSVNEIDVVAFSSCTKLESIYVDKRNPSYTSVDGALYNKSKTIIEACPCGKRGEFEIPQFVTSIGFGAFEGCVELTNIKISNSITSIGDGAFCECNKLTSLEIPNSVTELGRYLFVDCKELTSIHCRIEKIKDVKIADNIFEDFDTHKCILYVPVGTGYAYRHHPIFSQFKEVVIEKE